MNMSMTEHAAVRCEERSIPGVVVDLILDFGAVEHHRGREKMWLDKKGLRQARRYLGKPHQTYAELLRQTYLIVDHGAVVTVARKNCHHKRDRH
jgi:hypothetical protein